VSGCVSAGPLACAGDGDGGEANGDETPIIVCFGMPAPATGPGAPIGAEPANAPDAPDAADAAGANACCKPAAGMAPSGRAAWRTVCAPGFTGADVGACGTCT
jgi:hypothetical protein